MRLYTFNHYMLSDIQKGIQSGHATVELFAKYKENEMLYDWAENHKTHIALNGGNSVDLEELKTFLLGSNIKYPWAVFNEDESLGNLLTSISIILPEKIYECARLLRQKAITWNENLLIPEDWNLEASEFASRYIYFRDEEKEIVELIKNSRLA